MTLSGALRALLALERERHLAQDWIARSRDHPPRDLHHPRWHWLLEHRCLGLERERQILGGLIDAVEPVAVDLSEEDQRMLEALGYITLLNYLDGHLALRYEISMDLGDLLVLKLNYFLF